MHQTNKQRRKLEKSFICSATNNIWGFRELAESLKSLFALDNKKGIDSAALEMIAESIPSGVIFVEKPSGKIVYVNNRFIEITGFNPTGLSFREYALNMAKVSKLNNDPFLYEQLPLIEALLGGKTTRNQEIGIQRADGSKLTILVNAKPLINDKEEITGAIAVLEDVTELKKVEENIKQAQIMVQEYATNLERLVEERTKKIRESEQTYRELYESFGEAFIATDWELNVIHWNKVAERVTSIHASVALGKKIYEIMPEMVSVDTTPYLEMLQRRKPVRFMMNTISRETKKPSIFEISTYPSTQGIIIIVEDKTEEEETKRLSTIGQVAAMVGHDIRNPLQAILGDIYLLKKSLTSMPQMQTKNDVAESLDGIEEDVEYINKIVMDLQDYVKPINPDLKEIDIESILDDVLIKRAIPANIEVSYKVQTKDMRVISDRDLLKRILANLINNAVQAMPNGGKLFINAIRKETELILTVEDTGIGIPEDIKPKLFTPLFTTKSKGQGFGLAVVRRMVEALKGKVTFESEPGKGTKFTITLPAQGPQV